MKAQCPLSWWRARSAAMGNRAPGLGPLGHAVAPTGTCFAARLRCSLYRSTHHQAYCIIEWLPVQYLACGIESPLVQLPTRCSQGSSVRQQPKNGSQLPVHQSCGAPLWLAAYPKAIGWRLTDSATLMRQNSGMGKVEPRSLARRL
jgi:hypothetical protein